jgi:hypothetical protein
MQLKMLALTNFPIAYETIKSQKLPIKTAYKMAQLSRAIETELAFYHEKVKGILQEYAVLNEHGQPLSSEDGRGVKIRSGSETQCMAAMQELYDIDITLPDITFNLGEFNGIELTTEEIGISLPFLIE